MEASVLQTEQSENIDPGQFSTNCIEICNRRQHSYVFALWFDWMFPRCAPDRVKYYISTRVRTAAPWFSHHGGRSRTFALSQILCQMPFWMQPPHLSRSGTLTPPPTHTHPSLAGFVSPPTIKQGGWNATPKATTTKNIIRLIICYLTTKLPNLIVCGVAARSFFITCVISFVILQSSDVIYHSSNFDVILLRQNLKQDKVFLSSSGCILVVSTDCLVFWVKVKQEME